MAIGGCIEGYRDIMQASVTEVVDEGMRSYGGPRGAPHGAQRGQIYNSDYAGSFIAPNGHTVSGTDGSGILLSSTPVSKVTYMSDGNESWLAIAFECADGSTYAWDSDAQWYTDADGDEFDDHALMDLTNTVGDAVKPVVQAFVDSDEYGDALKSFKDAYHAHGGSVGNFVWDGVKSFAGELSAGGHRSTMAWGGIGLSVVSGGYSASLSKAPMRGLGNQFKKYSLGQIDNGFSKHLKTGKLELKYFDPNTGQKAYLNTKSKYSYNLDPGIKFGIQIELPHIDLNYPNPKPKGIAPKKKLPVSKGF
jgi:hypothetical protein